MRCRFTECCCCDAHTIQRSSFRGWLACFSIDLGRRAYTSNKSITGQKNECTKELSLVAETLEVSISNQALRPRVVGPTVCASASSLFLCMCIAHLNHSKPGKLGIIFRTLPSGQYSKRGEELAGEVTVTVLVLHECGVLWYYHNSESSLLNPLIQSQEDIITNWSTSLIPSPICIGC